VHKRAFYGAAVAAHPSTRVEHPTRTVAEVAAGMRFHVVCNIARKLPPLDACLTLACGVIAWFRCRAIDVMIRTRSDTNSRCAQFVDTVGARGRHRAMPAPSLRNASGELQ